MRVAPTMNRVRCFAAWPASELSAVAKSRDIKHPPNDNNATTGRCRSVADTGNGQHAH
jgi:hypothetical protein